MNVESKERGKRYVRGGFGCHSGFLWVSMNGREGGDEDLGSLCVPWLVRVEDKRVFIPFSGKLRNKRGRGNKPRDRGNVNVTKKKTFH